MLVAVIADTHMPRGRRRLPDACARRLHEADLILHAGDLVAPGVLADLQALRPPVAAVRGNVDAPEVCRRLPEERIVEADGARLAMVHDAGPSRGRLARLRRRFPDADAVIYGHSHIPFHEEAGGFQIFNPGSPTERRRQPRPTMGLVRTGGGRVEFELVRLD